MSGSFALCSIFFRQSVLPVCLHVSMLTGLPFCLGACISVCLHFCLCPRSCGIVTKCWLHTWQASLPACLAFWGFQALRIPPPGFLSFSLLSLLSSSVFSSFLPFPWAEPVVLYRSVPVRSVNRNCWLLAYAGITKHRVARFSRLCLVTTPAPHPTLLFSKQSSLSPTISSRLTLCSMRQKPHLAVI